MKRILDRFRYLEWIDKDTEKSCLYELLGVISFPDNIALYVNRISGNNNSRFIEPNKCMTFATIGLYEDFLKGCKIIKKEVYEKRMTDYFNSLLNLTYEKI